MAQGQFRTTVLLERRKSVLFETNKADISQPIYVQGFMYEKNDLR
jgi:hypothetical protein